MPPLAFMLPVLLCLVLAAVGLRVLASAFHRRGRSRRRFLQGSAFLLTALALGALWSLLQGELAGTRDLLVVYSQDLETSKHREDALKWLSPLVTPARSVSFLRLEQGVPPEAAAKPPDSRSGSEALAGGWDGVAEHAGRLEAPEIAGQDSRSWLDRLVQRAMQNLDDGNTSWLPWTRPTVLVVHDHGKTFHQLGVPGRGGDLQAAGQPAWVQAQTHLLEKRIQLFVLDIPPEPFPERLRIDLARDTLPAGLGLPDLPDPLCIRLPGVPQNKAESWRARLRGALDGAPFREDWIESIPKAMKDWGPPCLQVHLSDLGKQPGSLDPGFHRLAVQVELTPPGKPSRLYEGVRYLRAEKRRLLILHPTGGGPGRLGHTGWEGALSRGVPVTASLPQLLSQLLKRSAAANRPRLRALGRLESSGSLTGLLFHPLPDAGGYAPGLREAVLADLRQADTLALVEPTWDQLGVLDQTLPLEAAVLRGLHLLIIGPPARGGKPPGQLGWLPLTLSASAEGNALLSDRRPRLYLVPDHSRLTYLPASEAEDAATLQDVQRQILDVLRDRWGIASLEQAAAADIRNRVLKVLPPIQLDANLSEIETIYPAMGARLDTAPSSVSARLRAVLGELGDPYLSREGIRPQQLHPTTQILLFTLALPAGRGVDVESRLRLHTPGASVSGVPLGEETRIADLERLGVRVLRVELRVPPVYESFYSEALDPQKQGRDDLSGCAQPPCEPVGILPMALREVSPPPPSWTVGVDTPPDDVQTIADEIAKEIEASAPPAPGLGVLERLQAGRIVDERSVPRRGAPELHAVLESPPPEDAFAGPYATFRDDREDGRRVHRPLPAIVARRHGEGEVIAISWSPFSREIWEDDAGLPGQPKTADGWGLQRLIDLADLTGRVRPLPSTPVVQEVRELADRRTLQIDVWTRLFGSESWRIPEIDGQPLHVVAADPASHRITLQYSGQPGQAIHGFRNLDLDPDHPSAESRTRIYLHLLGGSAGERTILELLGAMAAGTGGTVFDPTRDPEFDPARSPGLDRLPRQFVHPLPGSWLFGVALCLLLIGLLGPLVRPWTALSHTLRRLRDRRRRSTPLIPPEAILDVDGVLTEWGFQPGLPSASRLAGTPAAEKPWESGEDLTGARRSTLVPFTSLGRAMGLPMRRPLLRQRQVTRALESVILVDNSRSLLVPAESPPLAKSDFAPQLAALLARVVWQQAGTVRAAVTRPAAGSPEWGPSTSDDDGAELESFVRGHLGRSGDGPIRLPELDHGNVLFLLSDLLAWEEEMLEDLVRRCGRDSIELRVAHLFDPRERELVGLVWNAEIGVFHDRTEWECTELAAAYEARTSRFRDLVERAEGRFLTLSTDSLAEAIGEDLRTQGFLS